MCPSRLTKILSGLRSRWIILGLAVCRKLMPRAIPIATLTIILSSIGPDRINRERFEFINSITIDKFGGATDAPRPTKFHFLLDPQTTSRITRRTYIEWHWGAVVCTLVPPLWRTLPCFLRLANEEFWWQHRCLCTDLFGPNLAIYGIITELHAKYSNIVPLRRHPRLICRPKLTPQTRSARLEWYLPSLCSGYTHFLKRQDGLINARICYGGPPCVPFFLARAGFGGSFLAGTG